MQTQYQRHRKITLGRIAERQERQAFRDEARLHARIDAMDESEARAFWADLTGESFDWREGLSCPDGGTEFITQTEVTDYDR